MSSVVADLRFAFRLMTRGPGLTAILVLTLALGIATSTAIFSVVNSVLIKPLPYKDPDRLVRVYTEFLGKMQLRKFWMSPPELYDLEHGCRSCEVVGGWQRGTASLSGGDRPVRVEAAFATHSLLPMLGVQPLLGRYFDASEDTPGDPRVVVLGYGAWQRAFGSDPDIVGKQIHLDAIPVVVVGVMPQGFDFLGGLEAWVPSGSDFTNQQRRGSHSFEVIVRLKPDASIASFRAEIDSLLAAWSKGRTPGDAGLHFMNKDRHPIIALPLHDDVVGSMATALWRLQAAALFVLLISIVNVANLLLARAETRNREIAVRHALGARRLRLVRQFLTESVVLGGLGGAFGVLIAVWAIDGIVALIPKAAPRVSEISLDASAVVFAVVCSLVASVLFGLAPILHARKADIHSSLKDGGPRTTGSKVRLRVRRGLVIAEVALAVVLVVGCAAMVRSFLRLQRVDLGFKPDHLLTAEIELPSKTYPDSATVTPFFQRLQDRARALPGVTAATVIRGLPPQRRMDANDIEFPGRERSPEDVPWNVDHWQVVGDDAVATLGMRLVRGRVIGPGDSAEAPGVVMVNQTFADHFWPGKDPIGQILTVSGDDEDKNTQTVVGVVADVKQRGVERTAGTEVFFTAWQAEKMVGGAFNTMSVVLRTTGDPAALGPSLQKLINGLDPTLPVSKLRPMDDVLWEAVARPRFLTFLLTAFAAMALLLAAIGIYGVMAHTVAQRTHEIGVRVALGAQPTQVRRMVLRQAAVLAAVGVGIGVVASIGLQVAAGTSLRGVLYGGDLTNPVLLAGVAVVVMFAALLATWIPARRATRVEPMVALRAE